MQIKTLDEILAQMDSQSVCAKHSDQQSKPTTALPSNDARSKTLTGKEKPTKTPQKTSQKQPSKTSQATPDSATIHIKKIDNDKLANVLNDVEFEPLMVVEDKATQYMRWLAFYYLSRRELSRHQLRQKLLNKGCYADAVSALLDEFSQKDYQSDERCTQMLIRESIRKQRGKQHIIQTLKLAKLPIPDSLDLLIESSLEQFADGTVLDGNEKIDWLKLAVDARCKKYGNNKPNTPKEKARQLRFLQYRGFDLGVCFDALKYTSDDF